VRPDSDRADLVVHEALVVGRGVDGPGERQSRSRESATDSSPGCCISRRRIHSPCRPLPYTTPRTSPLGGRKQSTGTTQWLMVGPSQLVTVAGGVFPTYSPMVSPNGATGNGRPHF
jgi:hypothetical protein